jgi:hypothetical protein
VAIKIQDDYVEQEEEVYLLDEGPFPFFYPRMKPIRQARRLVLEVGEQQAAGEIVASVKRWLAQGFGPEAWAHIEGRLADVDDPLDDDHLDHLFKALIENRTGRPSSSSTGASRQPWKKESTAAESPEVSDSMI